MYWVCILIYVSMYRYSYPSTHGISELAAGGAWEQFKGCLKMTIQWTQRYTPRPWSSEFGDALEGSNQPYLQRHLDTMIKWTWRCTPSSQLSEFVDALGGHDRANLEAVFEQVWRYAWRPWSWEFGDALGGHNCANFKAVIERVWRYTWRPWSSEFGDALWRPWSSEVGRALRAGQWTARRVLRLYSSVRWLANVRMWQGDFTFELSWRASWCRSIV